MAELEAMTLGALKRRVTELGHADAHVVDAEADPKDAAIALIKQLTAVERTCSANKLHSELESMTLKALKERGKELGMDREELDDVDEAGAPKSFLIELIETRVMGSAPGFPSPAPAPAAAAGPLLPQGMGIAQVEPGADADAMTEVSWGLPVDWAL